MPHSAFPCAVHAHSGVYINAGERAEADSHTESVAGADKAEYEPNGCNPQNPWRFMPEIVVFCSPL
jgi:hypothetical protein